LGTDPAFNAFALLLLALLVFVPIRYAYPSRNPTGAIVTFTLGPAWGIAILYLILLLPATNTTLAYISLVFPAWYFALSLYLTVRRRGA
jgi:phosphatidylcholine synthase